MTEKSKVSGAPSSSSKKWKSIDWNKAKAQVKRLQVRIAKAAKEGRWNKVKSLQRILTHSYFAKLLAVKRVTSRKGSRTPGVDKQVWNTPAKKLRGASQLGLKGYKAKPLRRILIPKKNGKKRALGIPCMIDRAMQALFLLALEPISEHMADENSYGFRPFRACRDAIAQCFCALGKKESAKWVLEADIKACFDWICHDWLLENIPLNKRILKQWLKCGYVQNNKLFPTQSGTPQGGIISPCLANMALDGLEKVIKSVSPRISRNRRAKVNFVRYADDFIVTGHSKEHLENVVRPAIESFLKERGLTLSPEKTKIVRIEEGFDFLGQNMKKQYHNKLITTPSKDNILSFKAKVKETLRKSGSRTTEAMIRRLNSQIRGWANYHRNVHSGTTFWTLNTFMYHSLMKWGKRGHGRKTPKWLTNHFWNISHDKKHFACMVKGAENNLYPLELLNLPDIQLWLDPVKEIL